MSEANNNKPTARWSVPLSDGIHVVEFEHGTASGRRVVRIDGQTLIHRDWMFRLVGDEVVMLGKTKFVICVDPIPGDKSIIKQLLGTFSMKPYSFSIKFQKIKYFSGFRYSYTLLVNDKTYENFIQSQSKVLQTWVTQVGDKKFRVVLGNQISTGKQSTYIFQVNITFFFIDKSKQSVWINGEQIDVEVSRRRL